MAIEQMTKDREKVCTEFQRDIVRFQELTMGSSAYAGQCPAPGTLTLTAPLTRPRRRAGAAEEEAPGIGAYESPRGLCLAGFFLDASRGSACRCRRR